MERTGPKSSTGPGSDGSIRLVTDMLNVPADWAGLIYFSRRLIEFIFKMFKHLLGCRHPLSTKPDGVKIQVSSAIIACMSILLDTGRSPTKRTFEMICFFMSGWASLEELESHIDKMKPKTDWEPCAKCVPSQLADARMWGI